MYRNLLWSFLNRLLEWIFRTKGIARLLVTTGSTLVVVSLGLGVAGHLLYKDAHRSVTVNVSTGEGLAQWASYGAFALGVVLILVGVSLGLFETIRAIRKEARSKLIVVELRGLHSSPDTPAVNAKIWGSRGHKHGLPIDFRPQKVGDLIDPSIAVEKVCSLLTTGITAMAAGHHNSDIDVAVGGLAAVPLLCLSGVVLEDESNVIVFDWDRDLRAWRLTDGPDDGKRFKIHGMSSIPQGSKEAVIAVSVSYPVDNDAIAKTFGSSLPLIELRMDDLRVNAYWSTVKQQALAGEIRSTIQALMEKGVCRIHMVLACTASLAIRIGMTYDKRLMPELIVYQYEKSASPPYPWGVRMPMHGAPKPEIISLSSGKTNPS